MKRILILGLFALSVLYTTYAVAQTLTTDESAGQKTWEVLLKLAFPVIMTAVGPLIASFIKSAPAPVKYVISAVSAMLVGAGAGSIPDFPLTPESAATIGLTGGVTGQALFNMQPNKGVPNA